jgi:hypothetical protein
MLFYLRLFLLLVFMLTLPFTYAQDYLNTGHVKCNARMLLGKWQLSKTFSKGAYHTVKKEDFNDVIQLKPNHRFTEEVFYESNHWMVQGQWHFDFKTGTLCFTNRAYVTAKPEDHLQDIILHIIQVSKTLFAGKGVEKGEPVALYYTKIAAF